MTGLHHPARTQTEDRWQPQPLWHPTLVRDFGIASVDASCVSRLSGTTFAERRLQGLHYEYGALPLRFRRNPRFWSLHHDVRRAIFFAVTVSTLPRTHRLRRTHLAPFLHTNTLFVHIPKAAGLSVTYSLYTQKTGDHRSIVDYSLLFNEKEFYQMNKFTIVRHPADRLRSAYYYLRKGGRNANDARTYEIYLSGYSSFREFVLDLPQRKDILELLHFRPQVSFLRMPGSRRILVDFVGKFEQMDAVYPHLKRLTQSANFLSRINRGPQPSRHMQFFDDKMIESIATAYRDDFDALAYHPVPVTVAESHASRQA